MADKKISELTEKTSIADDDLFVIVDIAAEPDETKKLKIQNAALRKLLDADNDTGFEVEQSADEDKIRGKVAGVEVFLLDADGVLTLAKQSSAKAYRSTDQTGVVTSTWTKILYNAEDYDIQSEFDITTNNRYDVAVAGIYLVLAQVQMENLGQDDFLTSSIYVNGDIASLSKLWMAGAGTGYTTAILLKSLSASDYIEGYCYHNYGSDRTIKGGIGYTFMVVHKIG